MLKIHKRIHMHAPVDRVFAYMSDPRNLPEVWPSMVEVRNVTPAAIGGFNFGWVYKMAGMRFEGASETTEYKLNQRNVTRSTKGIESKFTWSYQSVDDGTELSVDIEYNVPILLLGKIAETLIAKQNEKEGDTLLENLKNKMEFEIPVHA